MLSFKDFMVVDYKPGEPELISYAAHKRHRGRIGEACWQGYTQKGMKPKNGKMVPNCVPEEQETDEALDFSQRRARARVMKKHKARIAIGRKKAMKRAPDPKRIQKRADKAARAVIFKKLSKGADKSEMPAARKQGIEKRLDKMKPKIQKLARRLLPQIRARDKARRMGGKSEDK